MIKIWQCNRHDYFSPSYQFNFFIQTEELARQNIATTIYGNKKSKGEHTNDHHTVTRHSNLLQQAYFEVQDDTNRTTR